MPIHGVGNDYFLIRQLKQAEEVSHRYVCITSKGLPADYLYVAIEAALDRFLSRYLQTINISFKDVGRMELYIHTEPQDQRAIAACFQGLNQMIDTAERQISEKKRMKINLLDRMMAK